MKINEEGLRDWFGKSKSKDGKPGWVQSDGSPCANEPGETGTPKCYSSAKKASMSKKELRSADARKSRQDPGQQQKSGAAKPTYVSTDKPKKKMKEETFNEASDKKGKGSGTKDACYSKVKSRYSVWPSAYASGALVKCRKVGAANWGNSTKKEEFEGFYDLPAFTESQIAAMKYAGIEVEVIDEACWKGYEKKGMKTMFGKRYPNCVKKEEVETVDEAAGGIIGGGMLALKALKTAKVAKGISTAAKLGSAASALAPAVKVAGAGSGAGMAAAGAAGAAGGYGLAKATEKKQQREEVEQLGEDVPVFKQNGNIYIVEFMWLGKYMAMKLYFPEVQTPTGVEVQIALEKIYPGCRVLRFTAAPYNPSEPMLYTGVQEEVTGGILVQDKEDFKPREIETIDVIKAGKIKGGQLQEVVRTKVQTGNMYQVVFGWRGRMMMVKLFFPEVNVPTRQEVAGALNKMYPGSQLRSYSMSVVDYDDPYINVGEETEVQEDMSGMSQKSGDKRSTDSGAGMTAKGVAKYNRRTGGNLKTAVTTPPSKLKPGSKAAGRRKSFCARSKSWKGERGLAARRRWNCN